VIRIVLFLPCNGAALKRRRDTCPSPLGANHGKARTADNRGSRREAWT